MSPWTTVYQLWYIRESSVAIWVGNIICCWQLGQKLFKLRSFDNQRADIDRSPVMHGRARGRHAPDPFSPGDARPKPRTWLDRKIDQAVAAHRSGVHFVELGLATVTGRGNSQVEGTRRDSARNTMSDDSGDIVLLEEGGGEKFVTTTTAGSVISMERDGSDAHLAIAYRNAHDIF